MCCMHRVALCSSTASRTAHRLHLLPVALNALYKPHARYRPGQRPAAARSSSRPVAAVAATVKGRQEQQAPAPRPLLGAEEAFYAEKACTFEDLDINHFVADALKSAGFLRPSRVQVKTESPEQSALHSHTALALFMHQGTAVSMVTMFSQHSSTAQKQPPGAGTCRSLPCLTSLLARMLCWQQRLAAGRHWLTLHP